MENNKILVLIDIEGIIGVKSLRDEIENNKLAYIETEIVTKFLKEKGYHDITLCNIHDDGKSFEKSYFKGLNAKLLCGVKELLANIDGFTDAFLIGFHGKENSGGCFDHSFRTDIKSCRLIKKEVGEIGLFTRWLESKKINVLFVSGEGNFMDEVSNEMDCIIHNVKYGSRKEIDYLVFKNKLDKVTGLLHQNRNRRKIIEDGRIYVEVKNKDVYIILKNYKKINNWKNGFEFESMQDFFESIIDFANELNYAEGLIYRENINFIKKMNIKEKNIVDCIIERVGDYSILEIDTYMRKQIESIVNKQYEEKYIV